MALSFGWWDHFERLENVPLRQQYLDRIEMVKLAESIGIDGYHIAEHHFSDLDLAPSPLLFLAVLAQHTSRIRLGTMVLCLPMYHPTRLLQELCMVDQLSNGRLEPGVGRGVRDVDHIWLSSDPMDTRARFAETLEILQQGLQTGRLSHHGKYFDYDDVPVRFDAIQNPIRFWYGGNYEFAAENAMSCLGSGKSEDLQVYWSKFEEGRRSGDPRFGGPPPRAGSTRHLYVASTDAEAKDVARRAWRAYEDHFWSTSVQIEGRVVPKGTMPGYGGDDADQMMAAGNLLAGSPETVTEALRKVLEAGGAGYNYLVNAFQWGDITHEEAKSSMRLFGEHVLPLLRTHEVEAAVELSAAV